MRILVAYATRNGQTRKIAEAMAQRMRERGHDAVLLDLHRFDLVPEVTGYDAVVLGGPLYAQRHPRRLERLAWWRKCELAALPTAFFSVSLSAGSRDERGRAAAEACVDRFIARTGWKPGLRACFAGTLAYREYGFLQRLFMRHISAKNGGSTDMSQNHEYTDWEQVEAFTDSILASAALPRTGRAGRPAEAQELRQVAR